MNGFGTVRTRPLEPGFLSAGWLDGNDGENRVVRLLDGAGISSAFGRATGVLGCVQQLRVGPYTLDFAWPFLKIALEADGDVHHIPRQCQRDRTRDDWLRANGWLVLRVDSSKETRAAAQVKRVVAVVRAMAAS